MDRDKNIVHSARTLIDILRWRAAHQPETRAYSFLLDGESREISFTYAELDQRARSIGRWLLDAGARGERVLLQYPPGLDFISAFFGCFYAGAVAVPTYPLSSNRFLPRLNSIVADAQPLLAIGTKATIAKVKESADDDGILRALSWQPTDEIAVVSPVDWQPRAGDTNALAFLQYTSGSTGAAKGVMVSHGNLLHNLAIICEAFEHSATSRGVIWLPPYHDMGLIGGVLQPLFAGFPVVLMAPLAFTQRPLRWLQAVSRYRATTSGGPNFAYDLCVRQILPQDKVGLDLTSWDVAFNGAEMVRRETMDRFAEAFACCGFRREAFYPCYGLAEATLIVSGGEKTAAPVVQDFEQNALGRGQAVNANASSPARCTLVGSGHVRRPQRVVIAHPDSNTKCEGKQVGEVWVSGGSVAHGYWNRPDETERVFRARLLDTGEGPFLRTGDLGFVDGAELFITDRLTDLIIVRGINHYPQDIERTLHESHSALLPDRGAAFSMVVDDEPRLVVVQEVRRGGHSDGELTGIFGAIREAIAARHGLQVHAIALVRQKSIPTTSSGKIQRQSCRTGFLERTLRVVGEWQESKSGVQEDLPGVETDTPIEPESIRKGRTPSDVETWLISHLSAVLGLQQREIDVRRPFAYYGLDSVRAVRLAGEMETWLGRPLSPTLAYDYPTIEALVNHLAPRSDLSSSNAATALRPQRQATADPIALIGIGCRFPGASGPEEFWRLLRNGVDAISEVPEHRWDLKKFYNPDPNAPGKVTTRWGGFLAEVDQFDPQFFGIAPREAILMDPQQRLLLEVAWEAMEDAGLAAESLAGTATGVFIGISTNEYGKILLRDPDLIDAYAAIGNALSIAANRLSYVFGLRGPSMAVDTACSSSLVAVHLACSSLWTGESDLALAGGVNLILSPDITIGFSKAGVMAPDGRCKAFDARADGYVRGEGAGIVILKPLAHALADGDPIYAIIRGSAVNQDGRTNGLMAPSRQSQEAVLRQAYRQAGVAPGEVDYVEAHGTGTKLGDSIEAMALGAVLAVERSPDSHCVVGSVKANIGHLEAAAGIAGLIKTALSLKHRTIPPQLHYRQRNPDIPLDDLLLRIPRSALEWPAGRNPAIAGVSSFGFGGTNAHVVLEEPPRQSAPDGATVLSWTGPRLLPISARSEDALRSLAQAFRRFLTSEAPDWTLDDLCFTAGARRSHHDHRLALVGHSRDEFAELIDAYLAGEQRPSVSIGRRIPGREPKAVWVFSGQGSQWFGMGREVLAHESVFREALQNCELALREHVDLTIAQVFEADEENSPLGEIDVVQPALFAIQVSLAALWRSWGVEPDSVVGHSMGEVAAAHIAGALSLEDASRIICIRSRLLRRLSGEGTMAVVELPEKQVQQLLDDTGMVSIAGSNSPRSTVLSGDQAVLERLLEVLTKRGIFGRLVNVDVPAHSPLVDKVRDEFAGLLCELSPRPATVPIYSTVTGTTIPGEQLDAGYWARNLREPVIFSATIAELARDGHDTFLEISPHPILLSAILQGLLDLGLEGTVLASLHRNKGELATMLESLGALYSRGCTPIWDRLSPGSRRSVRLPAYPWQRESYWLGERRDHTSGRRGPTQVHTRETEALGYPTLSHRLESSIQPGVSFWEAVLDSSAYPVLNDHQILGTVTLSAGVVLDLALAAIGEVVAPEPSTIVNVEFKKPVILRRDTSEKVQLVFMQESTTTASLQFRVLNTDAPNLPRSWPVFASGEVPLGRESATELSAGKTLPEEIMARCPEILTEAEHYHALERRGLHYGSSLRVVRQIWRRDGEALARLSTPGTPLSDSLGERGHSALLDACFQIINASVSDRSSNESDVDTYILVGIRNLCVTGRIGAGRWGHVLVKGYGELAGIGLEADISLLDESGEVLLKAQGVRLKRLTGSMLQSVRTEANGRFFELQWQPVEEVTKGPEPAAAGMGMRGTWLLFADNGALGESLSMLLVQAGANCITIRPGEAYEQLRPGHFQIDPGSPDDFRRLIADACGPGQPPCRAIVHLWSLDIVGSNELAIGNLRKAQTLGSISVLHLVQAVTQTEWKEIPHLWLLTRGVQSAGEVSGAVSVAQAPLWGLGRVLDHEHPELHCTRVDLSPEGGSNEAKTLFRRLVGDEEETELVLRDQALYVPQLLPVSPGTRDKDVPTTADSRRNPNRFRSDHTYLVTGGLGGLGLIVAHWMVSQGARHLVLLGRSGLSSSQNHAVESMRRRGTNVVIAQANVVHWDELATVLNGIRQSMPPLVGIIHAAGVVDDGVLLKLNRERFENVMAPKMEGAWNLHAQTLNDPLEFFVLFSSAASLLGPPGEANYAAANAFLDALAHFRCRLGLPALSINWGPWGGVGLANVANQTGFPEQHGIRSFSPLEGLRALGELIWDTRGQIAFLSADLRLWQESLPARRKGGLLGLLGANDSNLRTTQGEGGDRSRPSREALLAATTTVQVSLLETYLQEQAARQLGLPPGQLDLHRPLNSMGLDSLMAVQLKNRIELDLDLSPSLAQIIQGPSVAEFAASLARCLREQGDSRPPSPENVERPQVNRDDLLVLPTGPNARVITLENLLAGLDDLSDHDVNVLLRKVLKAEEDDAGPSQ